MQRQRKPITILVADASQEPAHESKLSERPLNKKHMTPALAVKRQAARRIRYG